MLAAADRCLMGDAEMTDGSSAVALRFEILGPVRAYRGAEPVDLGPIKQRAVLALLLLRPGTPVPVPQIVAALWSGDPPENGVDVVQRFVGGLRRALDPDRTSLIALTAGGYVLRAGADVVDAGRFRAAVARACAGQRTGDLEGATREVRHALGLWRDEPLAGLTGAVFASVRARLTEERAHAAQLLAEPTGERPVPPDPAPAPAPAPAPTRVMPADPAGLPYPEAVDPWDGHALFPPDPLSLT